MISPENCDDGSNNGIGCALGCDSGSSTGWSCTKGNYSTASVCHVVCGDGLVISPEEKCDDGTNNGIGNGCSNNCNSSIPGWYCTGGTNVSATLCLPICSDGLIVGNETCDDDNKVSGDGCSGDC